MLTTCGCNKFSTIRQWELSCINMSDCVEMEIIVKISSMSKIRVFDKGATSVHNHEMYKKPN